MFVSASSPEHDARIYPVSQQEFKCRLLHCVANLPPNRVVSYARQPGKTRGDISRKAISIQSVKRQDHAAKGNIPSISDAVGLVPTNFGKRKSVEKSDPILELRGLGKEIWAGEEADKYVSRLRGGWE